MLVLGGGEVKFNFQGLNSTLPLELRTKSQDSQKSLWQSWFQRKGEGEVEFNRQGLNSTPPLEPRTKMPIKLFW